MDAAPSDTPTPSHLMNNYPHNIEGLSNVIQDDDTYSNVTAKLLPNKHNSPLRNRLLGSLCVLVVVVAWVAMAEGLQALQNGTHQNYNKPYFQTYVIHSSYVCCLSVWAIWYFCCVVKNNPHKLKQQMTPKVILTALMFSVFQYASALFWYLSLPLTSVSANTAIYQSSCIFIYILSIFMLKEKVTLGKVLSVLVCVSGVVVVTLYSSQGDGNTNTLLGFIWVLASTVVYSLAETLYGKIIHSVDGITTAFSFLFLGLIGFFTLIIFWPGVWIGNATKLEVWEFPTLFVLGYYVLYAVLDTIFNAGFFVGIHLTSPLFMSVGTLLAIPLSVLVDKLWHNYLLPWQAFMGMLAIVIGFLGLNLSEYLSEILKTKGTYDERSIAMKILHIIVIDWRSIICGERDTLRNHSFSR